MAVEWGALDKAVHDALEGVAALPARDGFRAAGELANRLTSALEEAVDARAAAVAKLRAQENLSLAQVAVELHVSKSRAAQLVRRAPNRG